MGNPEDGECLPYTAKDVERLYEVHMQPAGRSAQTHTITLHLASYVESMKRATGLKSRLALPSYENTLQRYGGPCIVIGTICIFDFKA